MKMKNCLIGFIIAIISIIPISRANALILDDKEYDLPDLPSQAETYPYYTIANSTNGETYLMIFYNTRTINNIPNSIVKTYYSLGLGGGSVSLSGKSYDTKIYYYKLVDNTWSYIDFGYSGGLSYNLSNLGISTDDWKENPTIVTPFLQDKIIYTNVNYFACDSNINNCSLYFSNDDLKEQKIDYFTIDSFKWELSGSYLYTFNFIANNYNENYSYQVKTENNDWIDITTFLYNENYTYIFNLYYNATIYFQVLDENGNLLQAKTHTIADLTDLRLINSFSSPSTIDLYSVDVNVGGFGSTDYFLSNILNYELHYGANDKNVSNLPILESVKVYAYGFNNEYLDLDILDYIDYFYEYLPYYDNDYERIIDFYLMQKKPFPTYVKGLKFQYIFSNNDNFYIHTYSNYNSIDFDYTENFLKDYEKYSFPSGYNLAIIRSKSFTNIDSSIISNSIYFSNPDYGLTISNYNFVDNFPIFSYLDYKKYMFNESYLEIPISINEENNVFPVLYKDLNKSGIEFYLHKDLFVVFLNSETLETDVFGISDSKYDDNNDLLIFGSIDNDVNDFYKPTDDNQNFFNQFKNAFNQFKNVIIDIFQNCTYFFTSSPIILQQFYLVVFTLILFIFLIRFIL